MFWLKKMFIISVLLVLSISCNQKQPVLPGGETGSGSVKIPEVNLDPAITKTEDLSSVTAPEYRQAMITFISGDVFRLENGEWIYAEIGDFLEKDDSIQVETDSFCEIQFGDRAVVRVEEDTELFLSSVFMKPGEARIGINLAVGSILCKVQKLTDTEKFNVRTQSVACGVRGTEFRVTADSGIDTVLSVKEGAVAILPPELVVEHLVEKSGESGEVVGEILEKIEIAAFVVTANEEIKITEDSFVEIKEVALEIADIVDFMASTKGSGAGVKNEQVEKLIAAAEFVSDTVAKKEVVVEVLSEDNRGSLKNIENMRMISIPGADNKAEPIISLHKFSLKIIPANAEILLNSKSVGKGKFSGIFEEGEVLNFNFISNNFESQSTSFTISKETSRAYTISLVRPKVEEKDKVEVEKEVSPIKVDKETEATEKETVEAKTVEVKEDTKQIDTVVAEVSIEKKNTTLKLEPDLVIPDPLVATLSVSSNRLVGSLSSGAGMIFTSDSNGTLSAITSDGRFIWSFETANKSVENSYPVFSNNRIYFSGSSEFVIINAFNGKLIERSPLDKNSAHIFGRRLVPFGSVSLFPSNNEIRVIDSRSGDLIRSISLPGSGSRMTPAVWNNKILSVDQNGTLSIINSENGNIEKEISTSGSQPIALSITIQNNLAIFSGRKGNVVCIDLNEEKVLWETSLNGGARKVQVYSDIVFNNTGAYIYTKGTIHALNINTGKYLFESVGNVSSPPGLVNNQIVFGDNDDNLIFMNSSNGEIEKKLNLDNKISTRPVEIDGLISAGTINGNLLVINSESIR